MAAEAEQITRASPARFAASASSIAARIACEGPGAGMIPSWRADPRVGGAAPVARVCG